MSGRRARSPGPRLVAALLGVVLVLPAEPVGAQDDWAIERDDRSTRPRSRPGGRPRARPGGDLRARYLGIALADPRDGFAVDRLLELYRTGGSLEALSAALEAERVRDPELAPAVELLLARLDRERGDPAAARARYAAITEGPHAWLAALGLYRLDHATDPAAARSHLERALTLAPAAEREELGRLEGELCLDLGDFDGAARAYASLGGGSRSVHLRTELARALAARGEHERALTEYRGLAERLGRDRRVLAPLLVEAAREELALSRLDEAIATLERARAAAGAAAGVRGEIVGLSLDAHRRRGTLAELAATWERSRSAEELLGRARALDELGRDDDAVTAYRRASRARPRDVEARLGEIQVLLRAARIDEAIAAYRALLRVSRRPPHVVALAELLEAHGRSEEAHAVTDEALRTARAEDGALLEALAQLFGRWGDAERATRALERRAALSPDDPVAIVALGDQLLARGDTEGAFRAFRRLLDVGEGEAAGHAALGAVLFDHDRIDEAIAELATAIRLRSERGGTPDLETLRLYALAEERAGRATAEAAWQAVLAAAGAEPAIAREAREHVVSGWWRARVLDRHVSELRAAFLEAETPDLEAGRFLVEALRRRGDVGGAVEALRRLDVLAPGDVASLELLERLEVQRGELAGAIDALERLARAEPRRAASRYRRMASHALALYRDEDALRYARHAVELAPDDAEAWSDLGELYAGRGEREEARAALRRAVELDPRRFELALALAAEESATGAREAAATLLLGVVGACPDDALVGEAVRRLVDLASPFGDGGTLAALESTLLGHVLRAPERAQLRRVFLDLVTARARAPSGHDEAGRRELTLLVTRGLAPILLSIGSADPAEALRAIELVRLTGVAGAAGTLLGRAEREGDAQVRLEALAAFVPLARREHAARLSVLAASGDAAQRRLAIWALALALDAAEARERALVPLLADPDREVRAMAAIALAGRAEEPLGAAGRRAAEAAMDAASGELAVLAWAFARTLPERIATRLGAPGPHAAPLVLFALARTEEPGAARSLALALLEPSARDVAARALRSQLALDGATFPRPGETASDLVLRALPSREADAVRLSQALADVLPAALRDRTEEGRPSARARAALRLLVPASAGAPGLLCDGVSEREGPRLTRVLLDATREPLDLLLGEPEVELRARAMAILAAGARRDDVALYERALEDGSPSVLRAALEARAVAGALGDLAPIVERSLTHADWSVRRAAVGALAAEPDGEAALVAATEDPYALVRDAAIRALGARSPRSADAEAALVRACATDPEERVRRTAAGFVACE